MRKLILWSMALCLAFGLATSAPALADDGGVINHGLLGVHPDAQPFVNGILQVTTVHEEAGEEAEWGEYSNWVPQLGRRPLEQRRRKNCLPVGPHGPDKRLAAE